MKTLHSYLYWPVGIPGEFSKKHMTCKFLGEIPYTLHTLVGALKGVNTNPPDPKLLEWEPALFGTDKNPLYVMVFNNCPENIQECHEVFNSLRQDEHTPYRPHVTFDQQAWDKIQRFTITPAKMGIYFERLTLKRRGIAVHRW